MKILIKGGVWKNTEDEIVKAAVMKYGKNQWSRVASLLNRKSAKQCKARWYEWLDPSIKKTEWSREEEEKLLHLAKLMPNQWRTIAPIVGRTASQCIEHYERLLDQAQEAMGEVVLDAEDPRRLRTGEIDPAPETKPARPDPIDMDDDEKEMLSEARARLANTKGKKAKRKLRELQLEESRRLVMLQKRRELKAAGIDRRLTSRKHGEIDYASEIPFQKVPPAGFHDVSEENLAAKKLRLDPQQRVLELSKLEGRHQQEEEERLRLLDRKKLKLAMATNADAILEKIAKENDPLAIRKRSVLDLPAPQVSESELEDIVKIGQFAMGPPTGGPSHRATQALIGDYSNVFKPAPTPMRTPIQEDIVMQEAKNLTVLRSMAPMSEDQDVNLPAMYEGTGFQGVEPRSAYVATPNVHLAATSLASTAISSINQRLITSGTPAHSIISSRTHNVKATPIIRDQLGLNEHIGDNFSDLVSLSSHMDKKQEKQYKQSLVNKLKSLPEPEYSYEINVPKLDESEDDSNLVDGIGKVEDAFDVQTRKEKLDALHREQELARRSSAVKRDLPRPISVDLNLQKTIRKESDDIAAVVFNEALLMMASDAYQHPYLPSGQSQQVIGNIQPVSLPIIAADELETARGIIHDETMKMYPQLTSQLDDIVNRYTIAWEKYHEQRLVIPTRGVNGEYDIPKNKSEVSLSLLYDR